MSHSGVTTVALADRLDISVQYASQLVNGQRRAKRNPILRRRIADVLGVPRRAIEVEQ